MHRVRDEDLIMPPGATTVRPRAAILQSNYIPWKGYFDMINDVDHFVLFDDVQYTRRDWRNRNKVKSQHGLQWLTIPVDVKGKFDQKIKDTKIVGGEWANDHWQTIVHCYSKAPFFHQFKPLLSDLYKQAAELTLLSQVNHLFIKSICDLLKIETKLHWSSDFVLKDEKSERLLSICEQLGVQEYVSGQAAADYLNEQLFQLHGLSVHWYSYAGYPEYEQLHHPFEHGVSIIDLLVHTGDDAPKYMRSFGS
jgi:WbqC-like protein family